jgi:hypothetical protein
METKLAMTNLKHHLLQLDKNDLAELLIISTKKHKNWKSLLLQKVAVKLSGEGATEDLSSIYLEQYQTLGDQSFGIIHEHNEYGGGPDDEYDQVDSYLTEINSLFTSHKLSPEIKRQYVDKLFTYYDWDNSGMTDMLMESIEQVSETEDDWRYVISKLQKKNKNNYSSHYRQHLILDIYKNKLYDDKAYLNLRQQNLEYATDYLDLIAYHQEKGELDQALSLAKQGFERVGGIQLLEWLFDYYRGSDYAISLAYLKHIFHNQPGLANYQRLKKFSLPLDWPALDSECRAILVEHHPYDLALIHKASGEYDKVLEYVLSSKHHFSDYSHTEEKEKLAVGLISHFPHELLPYFEKKVQTHLDSKERVHYQQAVYFSQHVRDIYCKHLNQSESWRVYLQGIRSSHARQPALLQEFEKL